MKKTSSLWHLVPRALLLGALSLIAVTGALEAQENILSLAVSGGLGGSIDEDDSGFSNAAFQARFAVETARHRFISVRLGRIDFSGGNIGLTLEPTLDYLSVSGEYLFSESGYESGFFFGIGLYDLAGIRVDGSSADESSVGLAFGALGEFPVSDRWFIYGEAAFNYANLKAAQMFGDLQIGVGFRF